VKTSTISCSVEDEAAERARAGVERVSHAFASALLGRPRCTRRGPQVARRERRPEGEGASLAPAARPRRLFRPPRVDHRMRDDRRQRTP
jgi:hypothetical protein